MRIAIAGQTYLPGNNGQAIFTIHLAEGLAQAGQEVAVITPSPDSHYRCEEVNGVQVYLIPSIAFPWIHNDAYFNLMPGLRIRSALKQFKPDVLHIQDHYFLNFDGVRIARQLRIPAMGTNHFLPENLLPYVQWMPLPRRLKIAVLWELMLMTYRHVDLITTPTETAARILRKQKVNAPIMAISCGVDTGRFCPDPLANREELLRSFGLRSDRVTLLYVGRQDREKRVDVIIRALKRLLDAPAHAGLKQKVQLAIAGQGAARREFEELSHALGLQDDVHFLGYVLAERLPDLYRAADVFCMPSPEELQSIATLEAMASGKPVLAANARALPELVSPGVNGYLFEPGNPASLEQVMAQAIERRDDFERMGAASRARAVVHSIGNTIQGYTDLYACLKDGRPTEVRHPSTLKQPVA